MNEQFGFISERKRLKKEEGLDLQKFGNYDLIRRIDVGGMGEVYLAHQRSAFGREVAVKIIRSDLVNDAQARQRFLREAEVASYLKHDHILPLLEFGEEQGRLFIVTPYISGGTLTQRLIRGALPISEVHELFSALCRAVSYLHKRGIVHRDLKPANILLDTEEDGGSTYVRLIDFGIASSQGVLTSGPSSDSTRPLGTADYTAPERLQGIAATSNDIYSLGVILHVMLTGALPRPETTQNLPIPLISVIDRCLEPDPDDRFASVDDLLLSFEHAYKSLTTSQKTRTVSARPAVVPEPSQTFLDEDAELTERNGALPPATHVTGAHFALENRGSEPRSRPPALDDETSSTPSRPPLRANGPSATSRPTLRASGSSASHPPVRRLSPENPVSSPGDVPTRRQAIPEQKAFQSTGSTGTMRPVRNASSPSLNQGTVLPSMTQKGAAFKKTDYNAPTTELDPNLMPKPRRKSLVANVLSRPAEKSPTPAPTTSVSRPPKKRRKRRVPVLLVFSIMVLIVLLAIGGVFYLILQLSTTASVAISPRVQTVSSVFTFEAKPGVKSVDVAKGIIPANVYSNSQTGSTSGSPTGVSGCVMTIFECKQTVAQKDVVTLQDKVRPSLQTQIYQNLHKQASSNGTTLVGSVVYSDLQTTVNPPVGTVSPTMTLSMTEQGSVEYFKSGDVQTLALQVLKQKVAKNYTLVAATTRVGSPVVRNRDVNGNITIAIAAAGVSQYQVPDSELQNIKNHIKGDNLKAARAFISTDPNLDPSVTSVRLSYGDTVPTNLTQIHINVVDPTNMPTVSLPAVK